MMRLSTILVFYFLVISLGPVGVVTGLNYYQAQNRLHQTIATELRTIADSRVRQLEGFLTDKKTAVAALAHDPTLVEAMAALAATFSQQGLGGPTYQKIDAQIRPYLSRQRELMGYRDVLLLSLSGEVLFSVARDQDLGTNVKIGVYRGSPLARAFENASMLLETEMSHFAPYPPSKEVTAFIAAPLEKNGGLVGVVAVRFDMQPIVAILQDYAGLGQSGEVLVGQKLAGD